MASGGDMASTMDRQRRAATSLSRRSVRPSVRGGDRPIDVTAAPRAVLRESVRLLSLVFGEERFGNAQANARSAMRADAERALERAELVKLLDAARESR
jgi:hypothetical protein